MLRIKGVASGSFAQRRDGLSSDMFVSILKSFGDKRLPVLRFDRSDGVMHRTAVERTCLI